MERGDHTHMWWKAKPLLVPGVWLGLFWPVFVYQPWLKMMLTVHPLLVPQRVQCHSFESTEERLSGTTCGGEVNVPKKQVVSLKLPVLLSLRLGRSGGWHFRMAPAKTSCIGGPNLLASISSSVRWTSSQSSRHDTVVVSDGINQNHAHGANCGWSKCFGESSAYRKEVVTHKWDLYLPNCGSFP